MSSHLCLLDLTDDTVVMPFSRRRTRWTAAVPSVHWTAPHPLAALVSEFCTKRSFFSSVGVAGTGNWLDMENAQHERTPHISNTPPAHGTAEAVPCRLLQFGSQVS